MKTIKSLIKCGTFLVIVGLFVGCGGGGQSDTQGTQDTTMSEGEALSQQPRNEGADASTMKTEQVFEATLEGSNEVPAVDTEASGTITVTLKGDSIDVVGEFSGLSSDYTASHIHKAVEGENGSPIITLEPTIGDDMVSGSWDSTYAVTEAQITALKADSLYVNVHSSEHKSGEIRGQLTAGDTGM